MSAISLTRDVAASSVIACLSIRPDTHLLALLSVYSSDDYYEYGHSGDSYDSYGESQTSLSSNILCVNCQNINF